MKKALYLILMALTVAGAAHAQAPSNTATTDSPAVTVTQVSWRKEVFIPALYEDPMTINQDQRELERDQKATIRANADRARQGQNPLPIPGKKIASNEPVGSTPMGVALGEEPAGNRNLPARGPADPASVRYIYEAKVKNTSEKTIRAIFWTYSLVDKETQALVGRHRFRSNVTIRGGKSGSLTVRSKTPPISVVDAAKPSTKNETRYAESVTIDRIEYADDTFWQPPPDPNQSPRSQN